MFPTRTALVCTATTLVVMGLTGSPASASPTCECSPPTHERNVGAASALTSLYADPLEALGGRTLAQYLSDHMAHRLSLPGV
jgi:hypothetical protein